jgi:transposase
MQSTQFSFDDITIFCGIDVHKSSWRVNIQDAEFELEDFSQDPDPSILLKHLNRKYPGAKFKVCYEAGFSGFSAQRFFTSNGIECLVVNAADVSTTDKEKRRKTDKIDARKLCEHLQTKKVKGTYVPEQAWEHSRSLVRARSRIVTNQTRCKNRIWQLLHFSGLSIPKQYEASHYWSAAFLKELKELNCGSKQLKMALELYIKDYEATRKCLLEATRAVRTLCRQAEYQPQIQLLRSIKAIGEVNAAIFLFELQNIDRFQNLDHLYSYAGFVPDTHESGGMKATKGITHRANQFLRTALIESAWQIVRKDPLMLSKYKKYCRRMNRNKAIIRIAKHLVAAIRYVLKHQQNYIPGIVA